MRAVALVCLAAGLALAQTARFPGAVATDQDLLTAVDNAFSQLAGPVADGTALTLTVNSGASFAGKTKFSVTIEGEQVLICSVSGSTLTICAGGRGFAGTTASAHPAGVAVRANNTAWHHNAQNAEIKALETALGANLANVEKPLTFSSPLSRNSNTISCPTCVLTSGSYTDPAWLTLSKSKVGLSNVENTALSTWAGSANVTTIGTLAAGTVPWARLSSVPSSFTPAAHTHTGTDVTSSVGSASALAANGTNCAARSAAAGVDANGNAEGCLTIPKQVNFTVWDPNTALPATTITGIWRPEHATVTVTSAACSADTVNTVIQLTGVTLSANLTCGSGAWASTTSFSTASLAQGADLGLQIVSGTAKRISVSLAYTGN